MQGLPFTLCLELLPLLALPLPSSLGGNPSLASGAPKGTPLR